MDAHTEALNKIEEQVHEILEDRIASNKKVKKSFEEKIDKPSQEEIDTKVISEALTAIDKDIFFSASVANKKTTAALKKRVEVLMLNVYQTINDAISKGLYECEISLNKEQRAFLSNKGFRVFSKSGGSNGIYICNVYWS